MKKNILIAALAALTLSLTACQKDDATTTTADNGNGNVNSGARVKTTSDLHGTDWSYTMTLSELIANMMPGADTCYLGGMGDETFVFGLNFDGTYAHFTFPTNIEAYNVDTADMQQIFGVSYTYTYDGTTHIGHLDGVAEIEEGETEPAPLQFTYNDATDVITFTLNLFEAMEGTPAPLTLNFARNE